MARTRIKTFTEDKEDGPTQIATREAEIAEELTGEATEEITITNLSGKHNPYDLCNQSSLSNSMDNDRMETDTEAKEAKEGRADPEENEILITIVTRTEDTEVTNN